MVIVYFSDDLDPIYHLADYLACVWRRAWNTFLAEKSAPCSTVVAMYTKFSGLRTPSSSFSPSRPLHYLSPSTLSIPPRNHCPRMTANNATTILHSPCRLPAGQIRICWPGPSITWLTTWPTSGVEPGTLFFLRKVYRALWWWQYTPSILDSRSPSSFSPSHPLHYLSPSTLSVPPQNHCPWTPANNRRHPPPLP